jgi:hypothetical protein
MKLKLLLCGAALLLAAGCASQQGPYASLGEYSFTYDVVQQPVPDISPAELQKIQQVSAIGNGSATSPSGALSQTGGSAGD